MVTQISFTNHTFIGKNLFLYLKMRVLNCKRTLLKSKWEGLYAFKNWPFLSYSLDGLFLRFFFFAIGHFDWPIIKKNLKLEMLANEDGIFPLASPFWWKKRTLGKGYEIKWNVIGNTLEDHIGNLKNIMETHWKPWERKSKEILSSDPTPKRKNNWTFLNAYSIISLSHAYSIDCHHSFASINTPSESTIHIH